MRRTDRLFDLIQILRDGRLHTARDMADRLEVSTRTLWRDMATLIASGLPVEGERGVGYILREPVTLPPLTLTPDEVQALTLGLQLLTQGADPSLASAADSLRGKIAAVLPARLMAGAGEDTWVFPGAEALAVDRLGIPTDRPVRPLVLEFWGRVWTLATWCETREDFRSFRVDRIESLRTTGETFPDDPGTTLFDWRRVHGG